MTTQEAQDLAAKEFHSVFDYRALRNGVQVGNIKMLHLDKVNKRAMEIYAKAWIDRATDELNDYHVGFPEAYKRVMKLKEEIDKQ